MALTVVATVCSLFMAAGGLSSTGHSADLPAQHKCDRFADLGGSKSIVAEVNLEGVRLIQLSSSSFGDYNTAIWGNKSKGGELPSDTGIWGRLIKLGSYAVVIGKDRTSVIDGKGSQVKTFDLPMRDLSSDVPPLPNLSIPKELWIGFPEPYAKTGDVLWLSSENGLFRLSARDLELTKVRDGSWSFRALPKAMDADLALAFGPGAGFSVVASQLSVPAGSILTDFTIMDGLAITPSTVLFAGPGGLFWLDPRNGDSGALSDQPSNIQYRAGTLMLVRVGAGLKRVALEDRKLEDVGASASNVSSSDAFLWASGAGRLYRSAKSVPIKFDEVSQFRGEVVALWDFEGASYVATEDAKLFRVEESEPPRPH
ncbi:hypothetical protein [Bradyrhizobium sp. McL0616]|uniref:hypothetical protein n=1 Tax=Bradyrhizobium sp. McL0616 TaxID=3415674 RepID=UPI003CF271C3